MPNTIDLSLKNMPERFHPAATWTRVAVMTGGFWVLGACKSIGHFLYSVMGGVGTVVFVFFVILCLGVIFTCMLLRQEKWFPRPTSTRSWAGRAAIGWNIGLCKDDEDGMRGFFQRRRGWREHSEGALFCVLILLLFTSDRAYLMSVPLDLRLWVITPLVTFAIALVWNDRMRVLADEAKETDARIAALIY